MECMFVLSCYNCGIRYRNKKNINKEVNGDLFFNYNYSDFLFVKKLQGGMFQFRKSFFVFIQRPFIILVYFLM